MQIRTCAPLGVIYGLHPGSFLPRPPGSPRLLALQRLACMACWPCSGRVDAGAGGSLRPHAVTWPLLFSPSNWLRRRPRSVHEPWSVPACSTARLPAAGHSQARQAISGTRRSCSGGCRHPPPARVQVGLPLVQARVSVWNTDQYSGRGTTQALRAVHLNCTPHPLHCAHTPHQSGEAGLLRRLLCAAARPLWPAGGVLHSCGPPAKLSGRSRASEEGRCTKKPERPPACGHVCWNRRFLAFCWGLLLGPGCSQTIARAPWCCLQRLRPSYCGLRPSWRSCARTPARTGSAPLRSPTGAGC